MDIKEIDRNFERKTVNSDGQTVTYRMPCPPFSIYGITCEESGKFFRVPPTVAESVSDGVKFLAPNTAGGRIRFSTDSSYIKLDVTYGWLCDMSHMPLTGSSGFVLLEETKEGLVHVASFRPEHNETKGFSQSATLSGGQVRDYILFLPLYNDVDSLSVTLEKDAFVGAGRAYKPVLPVLYYGSSITQGGCASRPDNSYQAFISKWTNTDFVNLGFSGNALGEENMIDFFAGIDCSVFVCDYDYNAPNTEYLERTHYPLYKRYRAARPDTPIVFISMPSMLEPDYKERREIVKKTYAAALAAGDKNVRFIDGQSFFEGIDRAACTVDRCHPNDVGFYKMAAGIYEVLKEFLPEMREIK